MLKTTVSLIAGIILGAAGLLVWTGAWKSAPSAESASAESEIRRLRSELDAARRQAADLRGQVEAATAAAAPPRENELDINRLLNDARPLLKSLAIMFSDQRKLMTGRMIRGIAERLAEDMGLTPEQTEEMIAHFLKLDAENFAKIKAMLDRPVSVLDVFTVMQDMNPQRAMDDYVKEKMTPEQLAKWENRKLEDKAGQLERTANWQLGRMKSLNLDQAQEDRIFDILVKKSPGYDPRLAVEGVEADGDDASGQSQDEAIAAVLREDQMAGWQEMQQKREQERSRWSRALGGFDPMQFLEGMGGFGGGGGLGGGRRGGRGGN